jgi:hypothetical protein
MSLLQSIKFFLQRKKALGQIAIMKLIINFMDFENGLPLENEVKNGKT